MKYILLYTGGQSKASFYLKEYKDKASFGYYPKFLWTTHTAEALRFNSAFDAEGFSLKHRMACSVISVDDNKDNYDYAMQGII